MKQPEQQVEPAPEPTAANTITYANALLKLIVTHCDHAKCNGRYKIDRVNRKEYYGVMRCARCHRFKCWVRKKKKDGKHESAGTGSS